MNTLKLNQLLNVYNCRYFENYFIIDEELHMILYLNFSENFSQILIVNI